MTDPSEIGFKDCFKKAEPVLEDESGGYAD